jgi:hypothetical protein
VINATFEQIEPMLGTRTACAAVGRHDYEVEGLDLNPEMLKIPASRCPGVPFHQGDMINFEAGNSEVHRQTETLIPKRLGHTRSRTMMGRSNRILAREPIRYTPRA